MQTETTQAATPSTKKERKPLNGVNVPGLFATIDAVNGQKELAKFRFRATNRWISGTHSQSVMGAYDGAGGTHEQTGDFRYDADHPPVLVGAGNGPTPVEFLLHALASCITAGIGNIAAARGIKLDEVESTVEGDVNLLGLLGLDENVRNGYEGIRINFRIKGDADADKLRAIVEQSRARSAVFDVLTHGCPVAINVETA